MPLLLGAELETLSNEFADYLPSSTWQVKAHDGERYLSTINQLGEPCTSSEHSFLGGTLVHNGKAVQRVTRLGKPVVLQKDFCATPPFTIAFAENVPVLTRRIPATEEALDATTGQTGVVAVQKKALSEEEKIQERNKKGRERSMRTRKRNAARLKNLQDNCTYLLTENGVLQQIVLCIRENGDGGQIAALLQTLAVCRQSRPPPHIVSTKVLAVGEEIGREVARWEAAGKVGKRSVTETQVVAEEDGAGLTLGDTTSTNARPETGSEDGAGMTEFSRPVLAVAESADGASGDVPQMSVEEVIRLIMGSMGGGDEC